NKGFRDLVNKYSQDEDTKLRGGDLRYFDANTKDVAAPVVKAAFQLINTGDVSGVFDARNGTWHILTLTVRPTTITTPSHAAYRHAQPAHRSKLGRHDGMTAQKYVVSNLPNNAKMEINSANLAKVRIATSQRVGDGRSAAPVPPPPVPGEKPLP